MALKRSFKKQLAKRLKELRETAGMSPMEAAVELTKLSGRFHTPRQIKKWESGETVPTVEKLELITMVYNLTLSDVFRF